MYIFSIYLCIFVLCIFVCANIFGAIVLKPRFKIDVVIMSICSIVIIINSVLTLQVLTARMVGISSTSGDFLKHPILVRVCAEQSLCNFECVYV